MHEWSRIDSIIFIFFLSHSPFIHLFSPFLDASLVAQLVKNPLATREMGLIPGLGRSPGEGNGYPLQYSGQENVVDCIVHGVTIGGFFKFSSS